MRFNVAYIYLKNGSKITLPEWDGYWDWDKDIRTIMMHCKDGEVIDIRQTKDVDYTMSFICRTDWVICEE